ncbi:GNAT family N-acetyltransferase [Streptomyces sp. NBC_00102]|uniref:GNAT family N-acetyltransferase n=1 Tax=Streptomyces sp. NBC_00102 TaxID=2975652 RepID=UPI00224D0D8C|nr:GNAT family N-acetyltransferase [Streptomyces sp. NBC_00102]MCX5397972.1 GNAT family N-acetyltransferase [Streptomyces sp. NBC_00102]
MGLDVRVITETEFPAWLKAVRRGFLKTSTEGLQEDAEVRLARTDISRVRGAFDDGRCVATFRSFAQELTVPGGARVAVDAISAVTVAPTHRRQGLLRRMMATDLAEAKERGEVAATLIAAEYGIYGRFGFGRATSFTEWEVDLTRSGLDHHGPLAGAPDGSRIELVDAEDVRKLGPEIHARLAVRQHGAVDRAPSWWDRHTGVGVSPVDKWTEPFYALYRSPSGEPEGLVTYRVEDDWSDTKQPRDTAKVSQLIAAGPVAERALWGFVCSIDWITTVRTGYRAPDDLFPLLLPDPRAARVVTHADWLWTRVLDTPRLLAARTYAQEATLVLDVRDPGGFAGGVFRLDASPQGAQCVPDTRSADLTLDVGDLSCVQLGDESVERLVALGRIEENRPGAAALADRTFRTARRPWCPDIF